MAILIECAVCHSKQKNSNKKCSCGEDLDKQKKAGRIRYWINFRAKGKQYRQFVGYSIEEAKDADGKRRAQKRENRIFDMLPEAKMTFNELAKWYLNLADVMKLASYDNVKLCLKNFNKIFGEVVVNTIKPMNLEEYQEKRLSNGKSAATVDMELSIAKTMVNKAFNNDMVAGHTLKAFRIVKRKLVRGENARKRILSMEEYIKLLSVSAPHLKAMIEVAFYTGMRLGELRELQWKTIDWKTSFIRLPKESTKENKEKVIPLNDRVITILKALGSVRYIEHDNVFTYRGKPIVEKVGVKTAFMNACARAGIPYGRKNKDGLTFHDIRRTTKSNMVSAGIEKVHRDTILGHSLQGMDIHYVVPKEEDLTEAMRRYTSWVEKQLKIAKAKVKKDHIAIC